MSKNQQMTSLSVARSGDRGTCVVTVPSTPPLTVRRPPGNQRGNISASRAPAAPCPPPSSTAFQRVLDDMKRENDLRIARLTTVSFFGVPSADEGAGGSDVDNRGPNFDETPGAGEHQSLRKLSAEVPAAAASTTNARQAWARLRVHVNVQASHEADVTSRWHSLCRAVVDASQPDRARLELYRRYIDRPDAWKDGLAYYRNRKQSHHQIDADLQKNSKNQTSVTRRQHDKDHVAVS